ncbi:ATP-grasp fold amidoligase family protein [Sphingomonas sp. PAMC 26605]|uniref:ATP-grasp fold amidoligase family protein n=1 Tax=Sphingomonas sp. PAMC 26605 TaxID=1112214 RepID=UPI001E342842|nr:ATP-grasp fold amidoligase family protein [Sphingomonas sp. PAMC 26605]
MPALASRPTRARARWRICLTYWWRHGRLPALDDPRTFTELVQARKLDGADCDMVRMADKVIAKRIVTERLGRDWIIPTLWHGTELPAVAPWPTPFVVKARHGCNQSVFVFDEHGDWASVRRRAAGWMRSAYGHWLDEPLYADIPRGLLVEPFVGAPPVLPVDYKFYVFGGCVRYVQVHLDRGGRHRWVLFDSQWRRISTANADPDPAPPQTLGTMILAAERLSDGRDFVRVDLYEIGGRPLFGEMTFYPGSGLDPFSPASLDAELGAHWLRARQASLEPLRAVA